MKHFTRRRRSQSGQAVLLVVVAMSILLIGALGLAIDGGQMYTQRQMAQVAADAAAQAGIMSILDGTNTTSTYPFGSGTPPIASYVCTTTDGRTPCVYARNNGFGGTASDTVTLSYPATVAGTTLAGVSVPAFSVSVQRTLQTGLLRLIPGTPSTSSISAKAAAGIVGTVPKYCIYALAPSAQDAFFADNGASVTVSGCTIMVNSTNSKAAEIYGGASVTATALDVAGNCNCTGTYPPLVTGSTPVSDPFKSLPAPTPVACALSGHPTMTSPGSNAVLTPGTYCGGISVSNGATNVKFSTGNYIIYGGGIGFGGGTSANGTGVMFYLTGTNATYESVAISSANLDFTAPTSGPYQGVLFYQDRSITSSSNAGFAGTSTMKLSGSLYFPTTDVAFSNGSSTESYTTAIVAQLISITGGANIKFDSTGTLTGLLSKSAAIMQ